MKRFLAAALTLLMVVLLCASAGAAATPSASGAVAVDYDYDAVTKITDTQALKDIYSDKTILQIAKDLGVEDAYQCSVLTAFDLVSTPGKHVFTVAALANMRVVLLHYVNGAWKLEYDGYADETGSFEVELDSCSPFVIIGRAGFRNKNISPKTGDQPVELIFGVLLLSAVAGAFALKTGRA